MSKKIQAQTDKNEKKITLKDEQFTFLKSLDTVQRSFAYYLDQLKTEFLQTVAIADGFNPEDKLELSINLGDDNKELTVKKITE